jgi:fatty acid-binding protein DegV
MFKTEKLASVSVKFVLILNLSLSASSAFLEVAVYLKKPLPVRVLVIDSPSVDILPLSAVQVPVTCGRD